VSLEGKSGEALPPLSSRRAYHPNPILTERVRSSRPLQASRTQPRPPQAPQLPSRLAQQLSLSLVSTRGLVEGDECAGGTALMDSDLQVAFWMIPFRESRNLEGSRMQQLRRVNDTVLGGTTLRHPKLLQGELLFLHLALQSKTRRTPKQTVLLLWSCANDKPPSR